MDERLPKIFNDAELLKDWSASLQMLQTLSSTGSLNPLPDWLAVEIIWMEVQFEQQLLKIDQHTQHQFIKKSLLTLKNLPYYQELIQFNQQVQILDQQYLRSQGIDIIINKLSEYLAHPKSKEISPHPLFNIFHYKHLERLNQSPHHPLVHFFRHSSGCRNKSPVPNPYFDCDWYRENYLQDQPFKNPLLHYLAHFHETGIQPSQYFNNDYVRQTQKIPADVDPLAYYLKQLQSQGVNFRKNGFSPCPYFDREYYLASYQDIKTATEERGLEPFQHFSVSGIKEGRLGHPWLRRNMATQSMVEKFPANKRLAVLILGMHRSGTSAITRMINLLGLDVTTDLMPPASANPTGYWESVELREIHDGMLSSLDSSWDSILAIDDSKFETETIARFKTLLIDYIVREFSGSESFVIKDPRMCRLIPLWLDVLNGLNVQIKIVLPFRHPLEVAKSLQKREGFCLEKSFLLWLRHVLNAEKYTRGVKRCFVSYSQIVTNPQKVINAIAEQYSIDVPNISDSEEQIKQFIDGQYYHQRITDFELNEANLSGWILQVYEILNEWSEYTGDEQHFMNQLDNIAESMRQADKLYGNIIREKNNLHSAQLQTNKQACELAIQIKQLLEQNSGLEAIAKHNSLK